MYQQQSGMIPANIKGIADSIINSVDIDSRGSTASVSLSFPIREMMDLSKSMGGGTPFGSPFSGPGNPLDNLKDLGGFFN